MIVQMEVLLPEWQVTCGRIVDLGCLSGRGRGICAIPLLSRLQTPCAGCSSVTLHFQQSTASAGVGFACIDLLTGIQPQC